MIIPSPNSRTFPKRERERETRRCTIGGYYSFAIPSIPLRDGEKRECCYVDQASLPLGSHILKLVDVCCSQTGTVLIFDITKTLLGQQP